MGPDALVRHAVLPLALVATLLGPRVASAGPVNVEFAMQFAYGTLTFGAGEPVARNVQSLGSLIPAVLYVDERSFELSGTLELVTGAFEGQEVTFDSSGNARSTYTYGAGSVFVAFDLLDPDSGDLQISGTFAAPVGKLVAHITDDTGAGLPHGSVDSLTVGEGHFDQQTADFLGIRAQTAGGLWRVFLDPPNGPPTDYTAASRTMVSFGVLEVTAVPEPTLSALFALAIGAVAVRKRSPKR